MPPSSRRCFLHRLLALASVLACLLRTAALAASAATPPPGGVVLVPPDAAAFAPDIRIDDSTTWRIEKTSVSGRPFSEALRLVTLRPSAQPWRLGVAAPTRSPIRKGDVLWVTFQSRRVHSLQETGEAVAEVVLMQKTPAGQEVRPLERGFSCALDWVETSLPFVASQDSAAGEAALAIRFGAAVQSFEIGGVALINYGPEADLAALPKTVTRYEGHAPDAPWRAAAAERIEHLRKGDFPFRVLDAAGRPVPGAEISVSMRRHAFKWGTAIDPRRLLADHPDSARYRETIEKYFNLASFENDMKWGRRLGHSPSDTARILRGFDWLAAHDIPVRGQVLVWPSWRYVPAFLRDLEKNPAGLRAVTADHIIAHTAHWGDRLAEWDVINEAYAHNDLIRILGREVMLDWFHLARRGAPNAKLIYNDYTMFHGTAPDSPSQHFFDTIKYLQDHGAPIEGFGEQAHFGGNPPGPATILAQLDRFSVFGLPIQITEYDMETPDEQLQADFTRDFTVAIFSHPAVTGMVQWGFWEGQHWKPSTALWRKDWTLRPHGQAWVDLVSKTWWTETAGRTDDDGAYSTRGFYGDYEITVTHAGLSQTERVSLRPGAPVHTLTLP